MPLAVLSLGTYLRARLDGGLDTSAVMRDAFDERFFREPLWIAAHNLFRRPTPRLRYAPVRLPPVIMGPLILVGLCLAVARNGVFR